MMSNGKMIEVPYEQDPYSTIGKYIRDNIEVIEDIIAVIELNGVKTNELFMVDMDDDGLFVWKSDWWEGEEKVALLDFFPVSEATHLSAEPVRMKAKDICDTAYGHCEFKCSACGVEIGVVEGGELDGGYFKFCPNCGADMRGDEDEESNELRSKER